MRVIHIEVFHKYSTNSTFDYELKVVLLSVIMSEIATAASKHPYSFGCFQSSRLRNQ